jgi:hypothetical protein
MTPSSSTRGSSCSAEAIASPAAICRRRSIATPRAEATGSYNDRPWPRIAVTHVTADS